MGSTLQKNEPRNWNEKIEKKRGHTEAKQSPHPYKPKVGHPAQQQGCRALPARGTRGVPRNWGKPGATKPKVSYPFTGMVAGLASLNVNLLLAARRVTSLLALVLAASLAPVLGWLFGPAMELLSSG